MTKKYDTDYAYHLYWNELLISLWKIVKPDSLYRFVNKKGKSKRHHDKDKSVMYDPQHLPIIAEQISTWYRKKSAY